MHLPPVEILQCEQASVLPVAADDLLRDIAPIETVIGRVNGLFACFARPQCLCFGLDQFLQGSQQVVLAENFSGQRSMTSRRFSMLSAWDASMG